MEYASPGEIIGLVIDEKTATVGWDIVEICLLRVQCSVGTLEKVAVQRDLGTVEISCAVWVPYLGRVKHVPPDLVFVVSRWEVIDIYFKVL